MYFHIYKSPPWKGDIKISGSKNAALPILFSCLLTSKTIKLKNIPKLKDIENTLKLFKKLNVKINKKKDNLYINAKNIENNKINKKLSNSIRASIWLLSTLTIRLGKIKIYSPGGCNIGNRKIDLHINSLNKLGININIKNDLIKTKINKLKGNIINFKKISVGATINSILCAVLIKNNITTINNIAIEPEIIDTINFLKKIGAKIYWIKKKKIKILGVKELHEGTYTIISDRIETGTFLVGGLISKGNITCYNTNYKFISIIIKMFQKIGANIKTGNDFISLNIKKKHKSINVYTNVYPGFPTDMQPQFTLLNTVANGNSIIKDNIFKKRHAHICELNKMGALLKIKNNKIYCKGIKNIKGNNVFGNDLRCTATLILAGSIALGETKIYLADNVDRGYLSIEKKLKKVGLNIKRII